MLKILFIFSAAILLIYLIVPGPSSIEDFPALPNSVKSTLPGDTVQVPNVAAYFSNHYRPFVTKFYKDNYGQQTWIPFSSIRLNYPPEFAYTAIKDQTKSTYLEEYVYPLRGSLFVNGYEPFYENGQPKFWGSVKADEQNNIFYTKTTLRYYPADFWVKLVVWLGIVITVSFLWKVGRRIIYD